MKKYLQPGIAVFSVLVFTLSLVVFNQNSKIETGNVKSSTDSFIIPKPKNAAAVSTNNTENSKETAYVTDLTKDQIIEFYRTLAKLNNWSEVDNLTYTTEKHRMTIKVERESGGKFLVTYKESNL